MSYACIRNPARHATQIFVIAHLSYTSHGRACEASFVRDHDAHAYLAFGVPQGAPAPRPLRPPSPRLHELHIAIAVALTCIIVHESL